MQEGDLGVQRLLFVDKAHGGGTCAGDASGLYWSRSVRHAERCAPLTLD